MINLLVLVFGQVIAFNIREPSKKGIISVQIDKRSNRYSFVRSELVFPPSTRQYIWRLQNNVQKQMCYKDWSSGHYLIPSYQDVSLH